MSRQNNNQISSFNAIEDIGHGKCFSHAQHNQYCHLFQDNKNGQQSNQYSNVVGSANCVRVITPLFNSFYYSFLSNVNSSSWILDFGASEYMTYDIISNKPNSSP